MRLPEPMLARSAPIPSGRGWVFEPKLGGFRRLVCTHAVFRARSRRGWDMTHLLPELRKSVPDGVQLRLVAAFEDGEALFAAVCERGLEGVVAKRERDPYRPGDRVWVKTKNRGTARFAEEREGDGRRRDVSRRR